MIVGVAIRDWTGKIWSAPKPHRHHHIIRHIHNQLVDRDVAMATLRNHKQGFIDEAGRFMDRATAFTEAQRCRQISLNKKPRDLFSEDLW